MNVFGIFRSISSDSERIDTNSNSRNRNSMERECKSQSRKECFNGKTHWYDWVQPRWKEKELKGEFKEALKRLETLTENRS